MKCLNKKTVYIIIILAIVIRFIYVIETPITEMQHDVSGQNGHIDYIKHIYTTGTLPNSNFYQCYHPPLHHILSAGWVKLNVLLGIDEEVAFENIQMLTLFYSVLTLVVIYAILKEIKLKDKYIPIIMAFMAFHPTFIILSGSINNDMLSILLIFSTILWLLKWNKNSNLMNTIILAVITGACVMTKTSGAIVSIPIMYVFLFKFYREIKKLRNGKLKIKDVIKKYVLLFLVFGIISFSLGLWYPIRNYIKFNQPILYVLEPTSEDLYTGNHSIYERYTIFTNELSRIYCNPCEDYNIWAYTIKCSLFGEYNLGEDTYKILLGKLLILINLFLIIISLISMIRDINVKRKNKKYRVFKNILLLLYIVNMLSFISMNIKLPYGCTMDFRYIVPTLFVGIMYMIFNQINMENKFKYSNIYRNSVYTLIILFLIISQIMLLT